MFKKLQASIGERIDNDTIRNFKIDLITATSFSLFNVVFNQFYLPMAIDAGASSMQVGVISAAPAIGLILSPLWASLIERTSPKPYAIYPNIVGRMLILLPAFFGTPLVFVLVALAFQMLMGIQAPAYAALMTRVYPASYRGRLMGYVRVAMGLFMIPLAYLVGSWSENYGSSGPLAAAAITGTLSILAFFWLRESVPAAGHASKLKKRSTLKANWQIVKQNRELAVFLIATTACGFGNILSQPLYQIIQKEVLELSFIQIGVARTTYFACLLTAYFVVGYFIDKMASRQLVFWGLVAYSIIPLLYGLSESFPIVIIGSGFQGIGDAIWDIGILAYVYRMAPGREAVVFSLHLMLFGFRGTLGPLLSTGLTDVLSLSSMLITASVLGWIGAALFILWKNNNEKPSEQSL